MLLNAKQEWEKYIKSNIAIKLHKQLKMNTAALIMWRHYNILITTCNASEFKQISFIYPQ